MGDVRDRETTPGGFSAWAWAGLLLPLALIAALVGKGALGASSSVDASHQAPVVAVVDSGADLSHPALAGRLWTAADGSHGADFIDGDLDPTDVNGHGTNIAGIIAQGMPADARLMIVRVLDADNGGTLAGVAEGIRFAVAHGASVINLSLNTDTPDPGIEDALKLAAAKDVTVVAAAGNDHRDLGAAPSYPACSAQANVIAVGALDAAGRPAAFSNTGNCVRAWAPGVDISAAAAGGGEAAETGTSQAAAAVSARAAVALESNGSLSASSVAAAIA